MSRMFFKTDLRLFIKCAVLILGSVFLPIQQASTQQTRVQDIMLWKSGRGLVDVANCELKESSETAFRLVEYTGRGSSDVENIRDEAGAVLYKIPNHSLVRLVKNQKTVDRYNFVEVVGSVHSNSEEEGVIDTSKSSEVYEGYIFSESLNGIENHIIQIIQSSESLKNNKSASNTYWVPKESGDKFVTLNCNQQEAGYESVVFEVYDIATNQMIGLVAVDPMDASIFKNIKTVSIDEAQAYLAQIRNVLNQRTGGAGTVQGLTIGVESENSSGVVSGLTIGDDSDAVDGESASDEEMEDDSYDAVDTDAESEEVLEEDIPVYEGDLEYLICTSNTQLNVRSLEDINEVLFKANRFEKVIPAETFDGSEKMTAEIGGEEVTFLKVQFPDREKVIGWVAESFVSETSRCVSYQQRLGDDQPIICTASGSVNVRSEDFSEVLFQINRFEPVAIRSDAETAAREFELDGKTYKMIPVNFTTRNSEEGWIAEDLIQTKKQCEVYQEQDGCCNFPLATRPTDSYATGMRRFGANRDKGKRLHAGVDLYSTDGARVYTVDSGTVRKNIYHFYLGTYAVEVVHNNFTVRYGELYENAGSGIRGRATVRMGQNVGKIKKIRSLNVEPMLHFEMYTGKSMTSSLSGGGRYKRRSDLKNPTQDMRSWERKKFGTSY